MIGGVWVVSSKISNIVEYEHAYHHRLNAIYRTETEIKKRSSACLRYLRNEEGGKVMFRSQRKIGGEWVDDGHLFEVRYVNFYDEQ
jgi:hypothetical protein